MPSFGCIIPASEISLGWPSTADCTCRNVQHNWIAMLPWDVEAWTACNKARSPSLLLSARLALGMEMESVTPCHSLLVSWEGCGNDTSWSSPSEPSWTTTSKTATTDGRETKRPFFYRKDLVVKAAKVCLFGLKLVIWTSLVQSLITDQVLNQSEIKEQANRWK